MSKRLFLLFSHRLTAEQCEDAQKSWQVAHFVYLPARLQLLWENVPPEASDLRYYAEEIYAWLAAQAQKGDYVLIQGEMGLVFQAVHRCREMGLIPIYATTLRKSVSLAHSDGQVSMNHIFKHQRFRRYQA